MLDGTGAGEEALAAHRVVPPTLKVLDQPAAGALEADCLFDHEARFADFRLKLVGAMAVGGWIVPLTGPQVVLDDSEEVGVIEEAGDEELRLQPEIRPAWRHRIVRNDRLSPRLRSFADGQRYTRLDA